MTEHLYNFYMIFIIAIGCCIGSFLNVVALRAFTGESIVLPPSKCPKCGNKIKPYDNIPILSWLILNGKCRSCNAPISKQYPIVEFLTGLGFYLLYIHFHKYFITPELLVIGVLLFLFYAIIFSFSVVISITDIKEKVVFDVHTISLAVIIILFQFFANNFLNAIIGAIVGALSMELLAGLGWVFIKKRAFGTGDTYIAASIGALLGYKMFFVALILSVLLQVICIIPSFIKKLYKNKEYKVLIVGAMFLTIFCIYKMPFITSLNPILQYLFVILMTVLGFYLCRLILTVKSLKENPSYWPFGPSMLISMFLVALYGGIIAHFFVSLL
jgi:leader peptidase (prepilin peptidase)/N-methyltransferase